MDGDAKSGAITPETKIGAMLKQYPQLEDVLIERVPLFAKLRNPILRKTVAKVTTLRQAALVGGVALSELINTLRKALGEEAAIDPDEGDGYESSDRPEWFSPDRVAQSLDARPILDAGRQPMSDVMADLKNLQDGEVYELITAFVPAPLIEMAQSRGFSTWWIREEEEVVKTYFISLAEQ
jgi:uncharacterized protein (DUF2249 family)